MNYKNYNDDDLTRIYKNMLDYNGRVESDVLAEIARRGGVSIFERYIEIRKSYPEELKRINEEVEAITSKNTDYDFVRKMISSKDLTSSDLDIIIKRRFELRQDILQDQTINSKTITGSLLGIFIGSIVGGISWFLVLYYIGQFYFILPVIYYIGYFMIKTFTKQSSINNVVLVTSFISFLLSLGIGILLFSAFKPN